MKFIFKASLFLFAISTLFGDELTVDPPQIWDADCLPCRPRIPLPPPEEVAENVVVDLSNPTYCEGVLSTECGGVLTAPELRIQAQKIEYTRQLDRDVPIFTISCEGNLLIDYKEWVLVGDKLYYDFISHRGFIINGRTAEPPWYISGREMLLLEEGNIIVLDGAITTSEGEVQDVVVTSPYLCLTAERRLIARDISFRVNSVPLFWWPKLELDLNTQGRIPFAVRFGWGGFKGSYISILYKFLSWNDFKATARLDGFFSKGVGAGIETVYNPADRPTEWYSRNYFAYDLPIDTPKRRNRYRFQGTYFDRLYDITVDGVYDLVSDGQMAADYTTQDFDLPTAGRTELNLRRQSKNWIANLFTKVRVNNFQSVNQELPTFRMHWHPFEIGQTGIVAQNTFKATWYNFVFSDKIINERRNFSSSRIAVNPFLYRPSFYGPLTITPEAGFIGIAYSNSPGGRSAGQAIGELGLKIESSLSRGWQRWKHVVEPYLHYQFLTKPRVTTNRHFIFSIDDGLDKLNLLRFGFRNSFFNKCDNRICRLFWFDLWANAFFGTHTIPQTIPKGYLDLEWIPFPRLLCVLNTAWNFQERQLDFVNVRLEWSWSPELAFSGELRHRSRFDWRKADFYNFILESVRTEEELLHSDLSDRRDTFLFRTFAHLTPNWSLEIDLRTGWNRKHQPHYFEYEIGLARIIFQHWRLGFTYEHRESDNRYAFSLLLNPGPPNPTKFGY